MIKTYNNRYGKAIFELGNVISIRNLSVKNIPDYYLFSGDMDHCFDTCEKVTLITENRKFQTLIGFDDGKFTGLFSFAIHEENSSHLIRLGKLVSLEFYQDINAANELDRLNSYKGWL